MKILVIAADGAIGQGVANRLAQAGLSVTATTTAAHTAAPIPNLQWRRVDLDVPAQLDPLAKGAQAAFYIGPTFPSPGQPQHTALRTGVRRVRNVLGTLHKHRVPRLIYTSTAATLGTPKHAATGQDIYTPGTSPHALPNVAHAMEWEILAANSFAFNTAVLLPTIVHDPQEAPNTGLTPIIRALDHTPLPFWPAERSLNLINADTLIQAHLKALQHARPGQRYPVGSPQPTPLSSLHTPTTPTLPFTLPLPFKSPPPLQIWLDTHPERFG